MDCHVERRPDNSSNSSYTHQVVALSALLGALHDDRADKARWSHSIGFASPNRCTQAAEPPRSRMEVAEPRNVDHISIDHDDRQMGEDE
jgi:hypothetical protein